MSVLPSPIPHPLDYSPWQLPGWVYEALDWVVGVEWPEGNERAVWELADQWYAVATVLAGPRADAVAAAREVRDGYGGVGAVAAAFDSAWRRVAEGDEAPLPVLLAVSAELGRLVEECGCDIEGAKLEVWIELGILVVELLALAVAAVLTAGAASPAAGAAIAATRLIVQQIFKRLMAQLARKSMKQGLKEAGERAAKEVTKGGVRGFSRRAALSGVSEAAEEGGINLATQTYQNSTGRRHGLDVTELGTTALGGMAGGAVAPLAGLGRHATGRGARVGEHFGREMAGEVMADQAASLATGQGLTSMEDAARAAASGVRGSATAQADAALQARLNGQMSALAGMPLLSVDGSAQAQPSTSNIGSLSGVETSRQPLSTPEAGTSSSAPAAGSDALSIAPRAAAGTLPSPAAGTPEAFSQIPEQRLSSASPPGPASDAVSAVHRPVPAGEEAFAETRKAPMSMPGDGPADRTILPAPQVQAPEAPLDPTLSSVAPPAAPVVAPAALATPGPVSETAPGAGLAAQHTATAATSPLTVGGPVNSGPAANSSPAAISGSTAGPAAGGEALARTMGLQVEPPRAPGVAPGGPVDPPSTDRKPEATAHPSMGAEQPPPRPRTPEWYAARWAADQDAFERRRYRGHFEHQRTNHEQNRRLDSAERLRLAAERNVDEARWLISEGRRLAQAGHRAAAERYFMGARDRERWYHQQNDMAERVLAGVAAPGVITVDPADFRRINDDVGDLAYGAVETVDRSALTGDDYPPPIDRSRNYGRPGGLRPPLALHQTDIERQVPRAPDGSVRRTADPRQGGWFGLVNDGGPQADPTRGINCIDCTLSLFDTWMHARPRVAAPRTFDAYVAGDVTCPINGERDGIGRVEDITGGRFQRLCQPTGDIQGVERQRAIDTGYRNLHDQLRLGGHGSFAFVINNWEQGGAHIWVALNQNGTILYLDPQTGAVSTTPLYRHHGIPHPHNAVDTEVLVIGSDGRPMPLGGLRRGRFSQRPDLPEYPPVDTDQGYGEIFLNRMHLLDEPGSAPSEGSMPPGHPQQPGEVGPVGERSDTPSEELRAARERVQAERAGNPIAVGAILAAEPDLERVFAAGVTPAEVAAGVDPSALRRLVPQLDEAGAADAARLFADPRVQRMLDETWRQPPRGEPMLAENLVRQLVQRPDLARMVLGTPELLNSLTARPLTMLNLAGQQQAIDVLGFVLSDIDRRGAAAVIGEGVACPRPAELTNAQRLLSERVAARGHSPVQMGFDTARRHDDDYRWAFVQRLFAESTEAQRELNRLATSLAAGVGRPGWRAKPKGVDRVKDKLVEYENDASRLKDLAAAKVKFHRLEDLYNALDQLDRDPKVVIVGIKDRFLRPMRSGYRDILVNLRMSNGHVAELRLHLAAIDEVAKWEHPLYEVRRDLEALAEAQNRPLTPMEQAVRRGLNREGQAAYWRAMGDERNEA